MTDPELQARMAQELLRNEVLTDVLTEIETDAMTQVRQATTPDALWAARASLLAVAEIRKQLDSLVRNQKFNQARPARQPLA